jgi:tetratricopeptide (TPR) repeat protein
MDNAIQAFEHAIRLKKKLAVRSPWPSLNLGTLLLRIQRLDEAEARLRESIIIDQRFPVAHYRLGQLLEKQ